MRMTNANSRSCIYCSQVRPFTDEHIFPAGLGGDDRRYLLKGMVCGYCNTNVFSKLEARFMRASPAAIGRIFLQHHGRGKGKKASIPTIDTRATTVLLPEHGPIEAEVSVRGKLVALMQLVFLDDGQIKLGGGDHAPVEDFLKTLRLVLGEKVTIVAKSAHADIATYHAEHLIWAGEGYTVTGTEVLSKPPNLCIWREPLTVPPQIDEAGRKPTLYQRTAGQVVLRLSDRHETCRLLTQARKATNQLPQLVRPEYEPVTNPVVHLSLSMHMNDYGRVLAKIGVNLVAHVFGESYVRHHAFNGIKRAILTNSVQVVAQSTEAGNAFNGVPHDRHVMTLVHQKSRAGRFHVALLIRLYGASTFVHLSSNALRPPIDDPVVFVIDYNAHRIEQLTTRQCVIAYPPKIPEEEMRSYTWESLFGSRIKLDFASLRGSSAS